MLNNEPELPRSFKEDILRAVDKINSLMMLCLVYSQGIKPSSSYFSPYREQLITLRSRPECYQATLEWLLTASEEDRSRGIELVL